LSVAGGSLQTRSDRSEPRNLDPMRLEVVWGVREPETDGDVVYLDRVVGFAPDDVEALRGDLPEGRLTVEPGGVGKGASGPGVALVFEVAEHVVNDTAGLIGIGVALREVILRVSKRRGRRPAIANEAALGALAAAEAANQLAGARYAHTVPLNVDPGVGTDERDVWAACFDVWEEGLVYVIFMSPSGLVLGQVRVPTEAFMDGDKYRMRSPEEIERWWSNE
jgi:hypothetical protein